VSIRAVWERQKESWPHHEWSRFVDAGGIRWHVQQTGSGPVLLLIHGTGASTHSWRKLMPLMAANYTVIAVDLPGHGFTESAGASRGTAPGASIAGMSELLSLLLRELHAEIAYCAGHSAGAVVLCRMVLDGRAAPRVIISVNGAFVPLAGAAGTLFAPIARLMASGSWVPRLLAWSANNPANVARMIAGTGSRLDAEGLALYARLVRDPRHVAGALDMMGNWDLYGFERDLSRLQTPLALLVAGNDRTVPPRQAEWVRQRVARAEIHRLPGLGHLAHEEDPELLARVMRGICRAHGGPEDLSSPAAASADPPGRPNAP
jgi:magnesium chelatase accessory protein